ncbi:potassium channel family protein [Parendozoicomonas haliclonae]|uniref:Voltage-gated potassium channel n=1 Tax=Parendozoicomonas haliclonae TaxID=1960125 RepID=A0A1X7AQM4_9GAMM|nr:potassium channel family protein [Parendozoicomonas haliclonae]SMA50390.1 voltage-gated potassium channel [Parendozoicomonas haliclonae]
MSPFVRFLLRINHHMLQLNWFLLLMILVAHFLASWFLLSLFDETSLVAPNIYYYFYIVTASTVGYGDLSPETEAGRMVVSLFIIPGGITLFAAAIGKLSTHLVNAWRRSMKGQLDLSSQLDNHLVILGWHREATSRMIELIFGDEKRVKRDVVLVVTQEMENPDPERIFFIQTENLASKDACDRSGITKAARIIISAGNDDSTLAAALKVVATGTQAHIVCHFQKRSMADLLREHAPTVECHISHTTEMLVRSAQDPGSSRVQNQLLNTLSGPTQFSLQIPAEFEGCDFSTLISYFKAHRDALVLGTAESIHGEDLILNPPANHQVTGGQLVYYMARHRLHASDISWQELTKEAV